MTDFIGSGANDSFAGGAGEDLFVNGGGRDTFSGADGNDTLQLNATVAGGSSFDGGSGPGIDTIRVVQFATTTTSYSSVFPNGIQGSQASLFTFPTPVSLTGFERVEFALNAGTSGGLILQSTQMGAGLSNTAELVGSAGLDSLIIQALVGNTAPYSITAPSFTYTNWTAVKGVNADVITDFSVGVDKLDFSAISPAVNPASPYSFIGSGAFHASGVAEIHAIASGGNTLIQVDNDGNGTSDMEVLLTGSIALTATDFML